MAPASFIRVWVPAGLIVRDPVTKLALASTAEGVEVPRSTYYLRRIADGDLLITPPQPASPARRAPSRTSEPTV